MGDIDSQPSADGHAERADKKVEFLGACDNGENHTDVLRRLPQFVQQLRKRLGSHPF